MLETLRGALHRRFDVRTATSAAEGLAKLSDEPDRYAVVISDMRMPVIDGTAFLREACRLAPDATRILLTGDADLDAAVSAVNEGQLYRFLLKPCPAEHMRDVCAAASEEHRVKAAERVLLEQTLKGSVKALADILALANPPAFGRSVRVREHVATLAEALAVSQPWELEVAALLVHVGAVILPAETAEKLYAGAQLTLGERAMVDRIPQITRRILENIPRLEGVIDILDNYARSYSELGAGRSLPLGSRILRVALDYDALEAMGTDRDTALGALRGRGQIYDPDLIEVLARVIGAQERGRTVHEIPLRRLMPGMLLVGDVRSRAGALLIARGHRATEQLIELLYNLGIGAIREPLLAVDPDEPTDLI